MLLSLVVSIARLVMDDEPFDGDMLVALAFWLLVLVLLAIEVRHCSIWCWIRLSLWVWRWL